ncbi:MULTISPECIES: DUF2304 domain-containing protein [Virgibacillus]|uniref:DUF2304 domain-containing protein n=1 Tax=Virgibacillus kapii TaxID=1638645 RepID=A0ABQ2DB37_9BACI|nr:MULTISPECIES: DUF2304 domain-containing protein [Virgibacillus]EQB38135.1 hypothetical protein M948_06055 [Virgibacillus sp. CM-4]MYL40841.1 DUF2304 family protein [Virgibacillus massiliensis]GGJ52212.1 hypothetical protein GCM10007111_12960 [Virgibacillus kapii]
MNINLFSFLIVCLFFVIVIESVRRGILETKDALIWLFLSVILGILSLSRGLLELIADWLGIVYAPSLLFLFGLLSTIIMIFDLTRRISKLNQKVIHLTQEFALLKEQQRNSSSEFEEKRKENI